MKVAFTPAEAKTALKQSLWEILLPILIMVSYFSGITTLVETAALATVYIFVVEVFIHKDLNLAGLMRVFQKSLPVIGGVLIILAIARGLSSYFIITEVPTKLVTWAGNAIQSKYIFLLLLNFVLLVTGCLMDVYSAILVIAPLVIPLGQAYGINDFHMAIIFIANLEIGYLTPPVGINLLLSSYRFNVPLNSTFKTIWPFLLTLAASLLLITYGPLFFYSA
jgi:tripartite ATP-independent transporter DctM subunit